MKEFLINGEWTHHSKETYEVTRPLDGKHLVTFPSADKQDVNEAVAAAKAAFENGWRFMDPSERHKLFLKWADLVDERAASIGEAVGPDVGISNDEAAGECGFVANLIRFYGALCLTRSGDVLSAGEDHLNYVIKEPLGVCGLMPAWNSPTQSPIQKMGPALAAGNTVVLRLPEEGPMGPYMLATAAHDAGFPPGVINAIAGQGPASGQALVEHPDVRLISFTGSVVTGKAIARSCAGQMKRFVMELGGKSPVIVHEDADLDKAAQQAVTFAFAYQGQICCANTRLLVQRSIYDSFVSKVVELTKAYDGSGGSGDYNVGPLFNRKVFESVSKYTEISSQDGEILCGGAPYQSEDGYYFQPTVVAFENDQSEVCKEEVFGPLLAVIPFDTEAESIAIANNVNYGLAATVYSEDRGKIFRAARLLESGTIWANCAFEFNMYMPWGGQKDSGVGREFGKYAMDPFLEEKNIWLGA